MDQFYSKKDGEKVYMFFQPQKLLGTIKFHPHIHIIE